MKKLLTIILVFLTINSIAQVATINDKDGFTNVREKPSIDSKVIYKLNNNKVFWYDYSEKNDTSDWAIVYIPKNDLSLGCTDFKFLVGFIHKSRLAPLDKMEEYKKSDFKFSYTLKDFNPDNRIIDWINNRSVSSIDGQSVWGTDGELPKTEIEKISIKIDGEEININKAFYSNLFECDNEFKVYKKEDTFFVYQDNSDGAGYYQIVWVLNKTGLIQRLLGTIY
ncbi:hypothetical protein INQ51_05840 [Maribellus sp. CM-23]|uniref:hypothetical protein n=1 Tax=Maribellus sp. CM-23 TaxID=2781026 RepID=UPI001F47A392|nr:hypothetical protein [Maribellus sp. CM-23]MCE4563825.1 hypothetical protein [Maribellus sp. CM-23]